MKLKKFFFLDIMIRPTVSETPTETTYTSTTEEDSPPFDKVSEQIDWLEVESSCPFNTDSKIDLFGAVDHFYVTVLRD